MEATGFHDLLSIGVDPQVFGHLLDVGLGDEAGAAIMETLQHPEHPLREDPSLGTV